MRGCASSSRKPGVSHDDQPTATRFDHCIAAPRVPKAVNAKPQPEHAAEWKEKVKAGPSRRNRLLAKSLGVHTTAKPQLRLQVH